MMLASQASRSGDRFERLGKAFEFAMQHSPTPLPHHKSANKFGSLCKKLGSWDERFSSQVRAL